MAQSRLKEYNFHNIASLDTEWYFVWKIIFTPVTPQPSMNFFQESVFLSEIIFQVEIAEFAETQLRKENASNNRIALWSAIQLILISSANVSKILWPSWKAN